MQKLKNYCYDNWKLIASLAAILCLVFGVYIIGKERFLLGYDYQYQHLYFYQDFHRLMKSGQLPFWSNNLFLGTNFWGSKSYYILGDPFAYLTLLFDSTNMIQALFFTYILKFICAALFFNHLLYKMGIKKEIRFIPALMYAFCGWATLFAEHPMFLVWHTFLPLILIGMENALKDKRYTTFIFGVFLCFISNYYFFWTTSVFMTFYWTVRYYQTQEFTFKNYLIDTLKLIGYYLIGVFMGMILILPSVLHLMQNVRVSNEIVITKKWNPIVIYLDILVKALIAPYQVSELGQMLFNTTEYSTNQLSLYSSVLTIILLPQIFSVLKGKEKRGFVALFLIMGVLLVTPYGASLMHGFKEPTFRWTLLLITCMIIAAAHILNQIESLNKKLLAFSSLAAILVVFILRFFAVRTYGVIWDHLKPEYNGLLLAAGMILLYTVLLARSKTKFTLLWITLLLIGELSYSAFKTLHRYPGFENYDYENIISAEAVSYIKSLETENSFYRIYVPYVDTNAAMPHNINLYYDYKGAYTYDSLYQFSLSEFVEQELNISAGMWQLDIKNLDLLNRLQFKYFMVKQPEFNLGSPRWHNEIINIDELPGYTFLKEVDGYLIYENENALSFPIELNELKDNSLSGTVCESRNGVVHLTIAYDKGWSVKVNGKSQDVFPVDGGFIGFEAEVNDTVELNYLPNGILPGAAFSFIGTLLFFIVLIKEMKKSHVV